MKKNLNDYLSLTLNQIIHKEWSSRHQNKYFACPSCGARFHEHHQGCKLEFAVKVKEKLVSLYRNKEKLKMNNSGTWPTNDQVKTHVFNDADVDSITDFNYYARAALIQKEITRDEYIVIERVRATVLLETQTMSEISKQYLRETLEDI